MTVCIAALFDDGQGAILASDHMITAHIPVGYEYEDKRTSKIHKLADNAYAMFAGTVLFGDHIINMSKEQIPENGAKTLDKLANIVGDSYMKFRTSYIIEQTLAPRGLTLEKYYEMHPILNPNIIGMVDGALANENLGVDFILVGPRKQGFGIYVVNNPGAALCVDALGYAAEGSGAPHVLASLIGDSYHKSLGYSEVKEMIKTAKEKSQVAPGVGKDTSCVTLPTKEE